ncbi:hypothetical protein D3C75_802160 [compost metagenome]
MQSQGLQATQELFVGIQFSRTFIAALTQLASFDDHHRHRHVDAGHWNTVDQILRLPSREKLAGLAARSIQEGELHRSSGTRHTIDGGVTFIADLPTGRLYLGVHKSARVEVANTHTCQVFGGFYQPLLDGERANGAKHVAAIRRGVDSTLGDHDLNEQIVDIRLRMQRRADDRHLAGLWATATNAVNFQFMPRAHEVEQQFITVFDRNR